MKKKKKKKLDLFLVFSEFSYNKKRLSRVILKSFKKTKQNQAGCPRTAVKLLFFLCLLKNKIQVMTIQISVNKNTN